MTKILYRQDRCYMQEATHVYKAECTEKQSRYPFLSTQLIPAEMIHALSSSRCLAPRCMRRILYYFCHLYNPTSYKIQFSVSFTSYEPFTALDLGEELPLISGRNVSTRKSSKINCRPILQWQEMD